MSLFKVSLVVFVLAAPGACGFQPLYGSKTQNAAVQENLGGIYIVPIQGRAGHYLRNELLDLTTPNGIPGKPAYNLAISMTQTRAGLAIRSDDTKTRYNLTLTAYFTLTDTAGQATVYSGSTQTIAAYNVVASEFANLAAENNAGKRAALASAEQIHQQLAIYFAGR